MFHLSSTWKTARRTPVPPVPLGEGPSRQIGIHFFGPLVNLPATDRYAITAVDYYKWREVCACAGQTTDVAISFLRYLFNYEGYPVVVISDLCTQLDSAESKLLLRDRGISHTHSSVYFAQANEQGERFTRVLKDYLQSIRLHWGSINSEFVDILGTHQSTPQAATGLSPSLLLHERQMRIRYEVVGLPHPVLSGDVRQTVDDIRENGKGTGKSKKKYRDDTRRAKLSSFKGGDYVCIRLPDSNTKNAPSIEPTVKLERAMSSATFVMENAWQLRSTSGRNSFCDPC